MKRTTTSLTGLAAAALLVLAGCGSETDGTAARAVSPTTTAAVTSVGQSSDDGTGEDTTTGGTSEDASTEAGSGAADQQTVTWFDTMCSGLQPVKDLSSIQSEIDSSDPLGSLKKLAPKFSTAGKSLIATTEKLSALPAPTYDGGSAYAAQVTKSFGTLGSKLVELAGTLGDLDPNDPSSASALSDLGSTISDAAKPLTQLGSLPAEARAALAAAPACQALGG